MYKVIFKVHSECGWLQNQQRSWGNRVSHRWVQIITVIYYYIPSLNVHKVRQSPMISQVQLLMFWLKFDVLQSQEKKSLCHWFHCHWFLWCSGHALVCPLQGSWFKSSYSHFVPFVLTNAQKCIYEKKLVWNLVAQWQSLWLSCWGAWFKTSNTYVEFAFLNPHCCIHNNNNLKNVRQVSYWQIPNVQCELFTNLTA